MKNSGFSSLTLWSTWPLRFCMEAVKMKQQLFHSAFHFAFARRPNVAVCLRRSLLPIYEPFMRSSGPCPPIPISIARTVSQLLPPRQSRSIPSYRLSLSRSPCSPLGFSLKVSSPSCRFIPVHGRSPRDRAFVAIGAPYSHSPEIFIPARCPLSGFWIALSVPLDTSLFLALHTRPSP